MEKNVLQYIRGEHKKLRLYKKAIVAGEDKFFFFCARPVTNDSKLFRAVKLIYLHYITCPKLQNKTDIIVS